MLFQKLCLILASAVLATGCARGTTPRQQADVEDQAPQSISRDGVFELTFTHNGRYDNPFSDVTVEAVFTSPSGSTRRVRGFFEGGNQWKVRFVPNEAGRWEYSSVFRTDTGVRDERHDSFMCADDHGDGAVRRHAQNPYVWALDNGKLYFPVGLNDCFDLNGTQFRRPAIDGEGRTDAPHTVTLDEYFAMYGAAGFNLLRFSQQNCSYSLHDHLARYRVAESRATDTLLVTARRHGMRVMFGLFGFHESRPKNAPLTRTADLDLIEREKRFIDYAGARWGAYVDFWELLNERDASDEWTTTIANHVRSVDPYARPITTSWPKPHLASIDINAPHWYETEDERTSDLRVFEEARTWKAAGKPVIVGEQGNTGMNWDPQSGRRMRLRTWTALFQEIGLVFWNTSWSKAGMFYGQSNTTGAAANIYLGPEERGYIRVLHDFSARLDAGVRMSAVENSLPDAVRGYALRSDTVAAAYLHHFADHASTVGGLHITMEFPPHGTAGGELAGEWIDPSTGSVVETVRLHPGRQTVNVPPFTIDLALLATSR